MAESTQRGVHYDCPNGCPETWFFQDGTTVSSRKLTESGEIMEDEHYDFTPSGPVKCYKCRADARVRTKTVRTVTVIE